MVSKSYDKLIQEIGAMSVLELADFVKALETTFGVSAAMPVAAAAAAPAAATEAKAEEKSEYKVLLVDGGPEKIKTIKALRQVVSSLGLTEAKSAVESASEGAPFVVAEAASKDDSKKMKEALEAAGAKVKLA